jgi:hypothetical protein
VQDLEQEHRSVWALPLAGLVDDVRFDRGFVELVGLPAPRFVDVADRILQLAPVRHLRLGAVREALGRLLTLPQLSAIRSLDLSGNALTDADIQTLARAPGLSGLRWLSLGYNDIGLDGVDALAASPHLRALRYVCLAGNLVDPSEKYSPEDHRIVDTWLPEEGVQLEQRHGRIPWLHVQAETVFEAIPDRFRIAV